MFDVNAYNKPTDLLLGLLKIRLSSFGTTKTLDDQGNVVYKDIDIWTDDQLKSFLLLSLSDFNQIPKFTNFNFSDRKFVDTFYEVLIEGAVIHALASRSLIERGREYAIEDNGVYLNPPALSDLLQNQFSILYNIHFEKLKLIKNEIHLF